MFSFRDNEGQAQYSIDNGATWVDFKHPAGTLSITANGTYNVADYASANVSVPSSIPTSGYTLRAQSSNGDNSCAISYKTTQRMIVIAESVTNQGGIRNISFPNGVTIPSSNWSTIKIGIVEANTTISCTAYGNNFNCTAIWSAPA